MAHFEINRDKINGFTRITTLDAHTGGEPLRIILDGYPPLSGKTILQKRQFLKSHQDQYRQLLMFEPRGHADMYGALITEPERVDSDFGILFMHNEGYSSMCGHAILAVVKMACQIGKISLNQNQTRKIKIDTPAGQVVASASLDTNAQVVVSFDNVASFAEALDQRIDVPKLGQVQYDIGFGGAYYAYVDADKLGISCEMNNTEQLIHCGRLIKQAVMDNYKITHPVHADLGFLYGVIFTSSKVSDPGSHSRHVCIFADGQVDRSSTGTGVSGRIALLHAKAQADLHQALQIESIVASTMTVEAIREQEFHTKQAVVPRVYGQAYITGLHEFILDPQDPLQQGFILR